MEEQNDGKSSITPEVQLVKSKVKVTYNSYWNIDKMQNFSLFLTERKDFFFFVLLMASVFVLIFLAFYLAEVGGPM